MQKPLTFAVHKRTESKGQNKNDNEKSKYQDFTKKFEKLEKY